jgi:hypothetical protein
MNEASQVEILPKNGQRQHFFLKSLEFQQKLKIHKSFLRLWRKKSKNGPIWT